MPRGPQAEGNASIGFEDPQTLARLDALETSVKDNNKNLKIVQNTNWLIVIVIFVAVLGVIMASIYQFIDAINTETDSRNQLNQSVQDLKTEVKLLEVQNQNKSSPTTTDQQTTGQ